MVPAQHGTYQVRPQTYLLFRGLQNLVGYHSVFLRGWGAMNLFSKTHGTVGHFSECSIS